MEYPAPTQRLASADLVTAVVAVVSACMSVGVGSATEACQSSKRDAFQCGDRTHAAGQLCKRKGLHTPVDNAWTLRKQFEHLLKRKAP